MDIPFYFLIFWNPEPIFSDKICFLEKTQNPLEVTQQSILERYGDGDYFLIIGSEEESRFERIRFFGERHPLFYLLGKESPSRLFDFKIAHLMTEARIQSKNAFPIHPYFPLDYYVVTAWIVSVIECDESDPSLREIIDKVETEVKSAILKIPFEDWAYYLSIPEVYALFWAKKVREVYCSI